VEAGPAIVPFWRQTGSYQLAALRNWRIRASEEEIAATKAIGKKNICLYFSVKIAILCSLAAAQLELQ
jgi:hypothetical protein